MNKKQISLLKNILRLLQGILLISGLYAFLLGLLYILGTNGYTLPAIDGLSDVSLFVLASVSICAVIEYVIRYYLKNELKD